MVKNIGFLLILVLAVAYGYGCEGDPSMGTSAITNSNQAEEFDTQRGVGVSARAFLSDEKYTRLVVEVDWIGDFKPSQRGIDSLHSFLLNRLNKPAGIDIILDDTIPSPNVESYTTESIRELERNNRDLLTDNQTLTAYVIALDARSNEQNVLGVAYNNTSMALFQEEIVNNSGTFFRPSQIVVEGAVSRHEFGHFMGLVNNGSPMVAQPGSAEDHHDEENGAHCVVEESLMHFQIRTTNFCNTMMREFIPQLEPQDIVDLRANGGK